MIGVKPSSDKVLKAFKDGTYRGFSIGGRGQYQEEDDDE